MSARNPGRSVRSYAVLWSFRARAFRRILDGDVGACDATQHSRQLSDARFHASTDVEATRIELFRPRQGMRCRRHRRFRNIDDEHVVTRLRAIAEDRERAAIED